MHGYYMDARVIRDPGSLLALVRESVRRAEPSLIINDLTTMPARLARDTGRERVVAYLASSFAGLTLLLAWLGIYGILASDVARRAPEVGVRMALGAQRVDVAALILKQGLSLTVVGVAVGVIGAAALAHYLQGMLFGVSALGLSSFLIVPLAFIVIAAIASYVPARRATRVDPVIALRCN
jgi:ABC-type antimicrobial peptide transport system permease subunit